MNFPAYFHRIIQTGMVVLGMLFCFTRMADGSTLRSWNGSFDNDWFNPDNWTPDDNYPQLGDTVVIES